MEKKSLVANGMPVSSQTESVLIIEQFLTDNYLFRRNVLNGKVEFKSKAEANYRSLTQEALNSIIIRALREGLDEDCNPKTDITMYVNSEEVPTYNPVQELFHYELREGKSQKREGDGRENEYPSRVLSPLYISLLLG